MFTDIYTHFVYTDSQDDKLGNQ